MMSDIEQLMMLERQAERARLENPWLVDDFQRQADILRERMEQEAALWGELQEWSTDKMRSASMAALLGAQYSEMQQRISRLASYLYTEKLITPAQFQEVQLRLRERTPTESKMLKRDELENKQYDAAIDAVYRAVGAANKDEARRIYNTLGGYRGEDKLHNWVRELIAKKLLPQSYAVTLRYKDGIDKLTRLILEIK